MRTIIRVGEKNNFNMTENEFSELKQYEQKGQMFVNSNSFNKIDSRLPSIITINPYMTFQKPIGDLSKVKAFRIKMWISDFTDYTAGQIEALEFADSHNIPVLLTFMRFRSKKTFQKYSNAKAFYVWNKNYYRPTKRTQKILKLIAKRHAKKVRICDEKGTGCKDCMNCTDLTYGITEDVTIKALNLSMSGVKDNKGNKGLCKYNCPDCWAKIVTYGKRPACDKLITNLKIQGKVNHV
jgi:hypothetical protein